jgi:hypothetical protein
VIVEQLLGESCSLAIVGLPLQSLPQEVETRLKDVILQRFRFSQEHFDCQETRQDSYL